MARREPGRDKSMIANIRRATKEDIPSITAIYDGVLQKEEQGQYVIGWIRGIYPTEKTAKTAVECGDMFVMEEAGRVIPQQESTMNRCLLMPVSHGLLKCWMKRLW